MNKPPCFPCRFWTNPRPSYVAGVLTADPHCRHWYGDFPNAGTRCVAFERCPGSDDFLETR